MRKKTKETQSRKVAAIFRPKRLLPCHAAKGAERVINDVRAFVLLDAHARTYMHA